MIIFYYGSDDFRILQAARALFARYQAKYPESFNVRGFDAADTSALDRLEEQIKNISFFKEPKFLALRSPFYTKDSARGTAHIIRTYQLGREKDIFLLCTMRGTEQELAKTDRELFSLLTAAGSMVKTFPPLKGAALIRWIEEQCGSRESRISSGGARLLGDIVGNDTWALAQEIEKLCNFAQGKPITEQDVRALVSTRTDMNIFDFVDALAAKDKSRATELLYRELASGRDPYYLLTMITYQFRNLLSVKDLLDRGVAQGALAKKTALHPFVVQKAAAQSRKFNMTDLIRYFRRLADLDTAVKEGNANLSDELYAFVFALS